ncbi:hypothetical protein Y032_0212g2221 [Ancylostoma ceylanicum]|nr:hypothetical protein Y032_0212g2221 [Ancylostoma ceylanicum]
MKGRQFVEDNEFLNSRERHCLMNLRETKKFLAAKFKNPLVGKLGKRPRVTYPILRSFCAVHYWGLFPETEILMGMISSRECYLLFPQFRNCCL